MRVPNMVSPLFPPSLSTQPPVAAPFSVPAAIPAVPEPSRPRCRRRTRSARVEAGNIGAFTMSAGGSFGGNRGLRPVPPEKGVFPLDHMHLCDLEKKEYLNCLKSFGHQSEKCRNFSKKYLQCRMEKNLMAKQNMSELGFGKETDIDGSEERVAERINDRN